MLDETNSLDNTSAANALANGGQAITLPHTWNATDAASTSSTVPYYRGIGWYRLDFTNAGTGASQWLQFDGASIVADVWLNGVKLGTHSGAFSAFRFDVTSLLKPGTNTLVVKANNSAAVTGSDPTAVAPLAGDFNMSGGLYRSVSLVSAPNTAHFALNDLGSSGIYAKTTAISSGSASVNVNAKLSNGSKADGTYTVRAALVDASGNVAGSSTNTVTIKAGTDTALAQDVAVAQPHLWNGMADPYLYTLVVDLRDSNGNPVDRVVQKFGIRQMSFDANKGFLLNGKSYPLHGVNMHQDALGKGWAISDADTDEKLDVIKEIGANTIRLAHFQQADYTYAQADKLGFVIWAENGFVNTSITNADCKAGATVPPTSFVDNLKQQTQELIRQNFNHASIGMWSIANEVGFACGGGNTALPMLQTLQTLSKAEDPSRVTTLADVAALSGAADTGGITDTWGINRYFGWYNNFLDQASLLGAHLDALHALHPAQPMGMSEYGAGAALSDQTDNPLGGVVTSFDLSGGVVRNYQPEGYASYVHEQTYTQMLARPYMWGTYVWNMFDFGSGIRNEGDVRGVNTKGLVSYDHQTRKDPFFFYQANWRTDIPVVHITGHRYTNRAYTVADVKVYSNTDSTTLTVNGTAVGTMTASQCVMNTPNLSTPATPIAVPNTCLFKNVALTVGTNSLVATGSRSGKNAVDEASWTLSSDNASNVYIAVGQAATGFISSTGHRYGSDNFFAGGVPSNATVLNVSNASDQKLWSNVRMGASFSYNIPVANGTYSVTPGFLEPATAATTGSRLITVTANGGGANTTPISGLDVFAIAGGNKRAYTAPAFNVTVTNGVLHLTFTGTGTGTGAANQAVVSNLAIVKQ
ncbi:glycoside hydrolase family 2 TIM barrel-domain containing protein [Collimonas sp. OK607]|uniref:glycoside hydrolase family 2 TIM barrel-domain containing protein n=1 Tax=Collimonas sp. OK607 TaxID=1798194 RepID=UPI00147E1316|nr:glycoside hydrolase family 2 TIM barrel-domain containing protein [Collimonas sp. OK607]